MASDLNNLEELRSLLGADCVGEREGKVVVSPRSAEQISDVARYANERKLAMEIAGAGTKRGWGGAVDAGILLETAGLAGVREHSWQDLTATVGAGTTWAAMQRELAKHGQFVALDPLWPGTATVGGIVATNDSGALRLKYGSLRDLIIGMTIVLADGTVAKSGGKVVKNVAGYDLHKLMTGAFGTLGVIAEVTFRLHPVPAETRTWTVSSVSAEPLGKVMMEVLDSQLSTQAMQLRTSAEGYALDVKLAALPEVLVLQIKALKKMAANTNVNKENLQEPVATDDSELFDSREKIFAHAGGCVIKATMLPDGIAQISEDVVRLGGVAVTQATGIMFAWFDEAAAAQAIPSLYAYVDGAQGEITILRMPEGEHGWIIPPWGPEKAPALMIEIKRRFDPKRMLNPGRFMEGI